MYSDLHHDIRPLIVVHGLGKSTMHPSTHQLHDDFQKKGSPVNESICRRKYIGILFQHKPIFIPHWGKTEGWLR